MHPIHRLSILAAQLVALKAAAITLDLTPVKLEDLVPQSSQGVDGRYAQARLSDGTYVNLNYNYNGIGNYSWFYPPSGSPRIYLSGDVANTTSGALPSPDAVYAPPGNGVDSILRFDTNLAPGFNAINIEGAALHFRVSGQSNVSDGVTTLIYVGTAGYATPVWTHTWATNNNTFASFNVTIPWTSGSSLYFAVSDNGGFIADHTEWSNVKLKAATIVPEPSTYAAIFGALALAAAFVARRRSKK